MGQTPNQTVKEIEETREQLAQKVDLFVDRARVEAGQIGKKVAIVGLAVAALVVVGYIAKKRVQVDD